MSFPTSPRRLRRTPSCRCSLNGYHDMVTPFFQTETDLLRLGTNPNLQKTFYRGGHTVRGS
jgi:hypothetical protein